MSLYTFSVNIVQISFVPLSIILLLIIINILLLLIILTNKKFLSSSIYDCSNENKILEITFYDLLPQVDILTAINNKY